MSAQCAHRYRNGVRCEHMTHAVFCGQHSDRSKYDNWFLGEPKDPGLYWVRGANGARPIHHGARAAGGMVFDAQRQAQMAMGQEPVPGLLGIVMVVRGPKGGYRPPRWIDPVGAVCQWRDGWAWARAEVPT